jgi:hypothetical protein
LLRDAEIERLRAGSQDAPARPAEKPQPSRTTRAAALDEAAERAQRRIEKVTRKLEALTEAGASRDSPEVARLRKDIDRAQKRLDGFQRRRSKLVQPDAPLPAD